MVQTMRALSFLKNRRARFLAAMFGAATALACAAALCWLVYGAWTTRNPSFRDDFDLGSNAPHRKDWQAFGGTWQALNGAMQNIADDRGAKLMNGDVHWRNYIVEGDVQLLGETGDAGFVVRASQEEVGVDSYHGYFAGVRDLDDTLILGRADYGWHEFRAIPLHNGVMTGTWYHLRVIAYGCILAARATAPDGKMVVASVDDPQCIPQGRFGLQSYSTGAVWRNIRVRPASLADLTEMIGTQHPSRPDEPPQVPPLADLTAYQRDTAPMQRELSRHRTDLHAVPIASLRLLSPNAPSHVTLEGVVTLVSPVLYVQDASGGIAIPQAHLDEPIQIGDAVEVSGDAELHGFSSVLLNSSLKRLWSHAAVPPVAVSAAQAATGAFDAQFIETEGRLESEVQTDNRSVVLHLTSGSQSFLAIAENPSPAVTIPGIAPGSMIRLRGICVTDRRFTQDQIPFAMLLRSAEDVEVVEPPPWWNMQHIVESIAAVLALSFILQMAYISMKRARLRAVIEERERLAMDMHDTLSQSFAGLAFQIEGMCAEAKPGSALHEQLHSTLDMVRFLHTESRRDIAALRPFNLERLGLAKALEQAAQMMVQNGPIAVSISVRGEQRPIPLRISDALFRIGQEAIANAVRHGHPSHIQIQLTFGRPSLKLVVRDDGVGFDSGLESAGFGVRGMKQRADGIAASFRVRSSAENGTSITVRARLPRALFVTSWRQSLRKANWRRWLNGQAA